MHKGNNRLGARRAALAIVIAFAGAVMLIAPSARAATVLGASTLQTSSDYNPPGLAEAFAATAGATATLSALTVYVDSGSTATTLYAGVYSDSAGKPGALLGQGSVLNPTAGAWVTVPVPATPVTSGTTYWIAILSPNGAGQLGYRDHGSGGATTVTASQGANGQLPASWTTKQSYKEGPLSAYGSSAGTGPAISGVQATAIGSSSATITWTTDVPSTSQVDYGTTTSFGSATTLDHSLVTNHSQTLSGLSSGTNYDYAVLSTDGSGTTSTSPTFSFGTTGGTPATVGQWGPVMSWPLVSVHLNLLHNGKLLLWDGWQTPTPAEVWDPGSQTFTTVTNSNGLFCSGEVQLADGRILVAGGHDQGTGYVETGVPATNIFDPATNTWTRVADMHHARWYPSMTLLPDGRVLAVSGEDNPGNYVDTPEVYDPVANSWTLLSGVSTPQVHEPEYPLSYVLPNGNVLVIAADTGHAFELNVTAQTWTDVGSVSSVTNGSADMYRPGHILFSGGGNLASQTNPSQRAASTLDGTAASPTWQPTGAMNGPRYEHTMVNLPDGTVFAMGGAAVTSQQTTDDTLSTEVWDPAPGTFTLMSPQAEGRIYHSTAALMPDGRVLVAGGGRYNSAVDHFSAQYFSPPYLFKGARPTITSAPAGGSYASSVTVSTPNAASITGAVLIDLATDTHTTDMSQREVPLAFTAGSGSLSVRLPATAATAPPGYYMLFIVNSAGVPSTASMIQLGGSGSGDTTPPTVSLTSPAGGATVSGTVAVSAAATDNVAVGSVQFRLDGAPLGAPLTSAPYTTSWDTTAATNGTHSLTALATDTSGNQATSAPVAVTVTNGGPPPNGPRLDAQASGRGQGPVTTAGLTTTAAGDLLVAYASSDGPTSGQTLAISGGGLTWSLVARASNEPGTAEIWTARAVGALNGATFTATQSKSGYDADLTVAAYSGAAGVGASATGGARSAPSVSLVTTKAGSLVTATGSDWDNAIGRSVAANQQLLDQWVDTGSGDTFWSQTTTGTIPAAGTTVAMKDTAPTGDLWNLAAAEITASPPGTKAFSTPAAASGAGGTPARLLAVTVPTNAPTNAPTSGPTTVSSSVADPTALARAAVTAALASPLSITNATAARAAAAALAATRASTDLSVGGQTLRIDGVHRLVYWCSLGLIHGNLASVLVEPGPQWPANPSHRPSPTAAHSGARFPLRPSVAALGLAPLLAIRPRRPAGPRRIDRP